MKKFEFRLQKVLDFREAMESLAKDAYLDARSKRTEAEALALSIETRRQDILESPSQTLESRLSIDALMVRLDDELRAHQAVISVLADEEAHLKSEWIRAKQDFEALVKLREKAEALHKKEQELAEQRELDEWATTRRAA